jgi:hypothetical protein
MEGYKWPSVDIIGTYAITEFNMRGSGRSHHFQPQLSSSTSASFEQSLHVLAVTQLARRGFLGKENIECKTMHWKFSIGSRYFIDRSLPCFFISSRPFSRNFPNKEKCPRSPPHGELLRIGTNAHPLSVAGDPPEPQR